METVEVTDQAAKHFALFGIAGMGEFLLRYGINLLVTFILVRVIYYPRHRNKDFVFTFFLFNTVNFLICFLLSSTKIKIGFAFGLFAIFSILRYRTVTVPVREMGYFFLSVTIGIINALSEIDSGVTLIVISNGLILGMTYFLDRMLSLEHENYKEINYERIELIHPDKRTEMIDDLKRRTGLPIHRIELIKLDFLRDVARIHAFYYSRDNDSASRDTTDDDD
jgi:hypothetical protein